MKQHTVSLHEAIYRHFTWSKVLSLYTKQHTVTLHQAKYSLFTRSKILSLYMKQHTGCIYEVKYSPFIWRSIQCLHEAKYSLFIWSKVVSMHEAKIVTLLETEFIQTIFKVVLRVIWKLTMKIIQIMSCVMWADNILISHDIFWILLLLVSVFSDFCVKAVIRD